MVGPKPKPVRPLTASKSAFEKPTENKLAKKKKKATKKSEVIPDAKQDVDNSTLSKKTEIRKSDKTVYLQPEKVNVYKHLRGDI